MEALFCQNLHLFASYIEIFCIPYIWACCTNPVFSFSFQLVNAVNFLTDTFLPLSAIIEIWKIYPKPNQTHFNFLLVKFDQRLMEILAKVNKTEITVQNQSLDNLYLRQSPSLLLVYHIKITESCRRSWCS